MNFAEFFQRECPAVVTDPAHDAVQQIGHLSQWQEDFCLACGEFNHWQGRCPRSLDDCLISRIQDCCGDVEKLRGLEIGQEITTDQMIDTWLNSGEPTEDLLKNPLWFICLAAYSPRQCVHKRSTC